jgi:hypothetical protein
MKPTWAQHLPEKGELDYVRSLLGALFMLAVVAWVLGAIVTKGPRAVVSIGRRQVGA